ncbi:hypothetical protein ACVWW7_002263 [Bradyrhizobium sp. LM6.9]
MTATISLAFIFLMSFSDSLRRLVDLALDLERELVGVEIVGQVGKVIAHEERVVRRDRAIVEHRERRLELRRPGGQADHRPLLRIFHQRPFAIGEGQGDGVECQRLA